MCPLCRAVLVQVVLLYKSPGTSSCCHNKFEYFFLPLQLLLIPVHLPRFVTPKLLGEETLTEDDPIDPQEQLEFYQVQAPDPWKRGASGIADVKKLLDNPGQSPTALKEMFVPLPDVAVAQAQQGAPPPRASAFAQSFLGAGKFFKLSSAELWVLHRCTECTRSVLTRGRTFRTCAIVVCVVLCCICAVW